MSIPEAPTNVTVVPGLASATVSWTASSSTVTGYKVFCVPDNKLPNLAGPSATSLNITGLKNGISRTFRVHALNGSIMSATSAASVPGPPPAAPKVVAVRGSEAGSLVVTVSGKPPKGSSLTYYNFSVSPPAPDATIPTNVTAAAITFGASATITGLTLGVSYVVSSTLTGPTGTSSAGVSKPVIAGDIPGSPVLSALNGIGSVQLSWTTPSNNGLPITGYSVSYFTGSAAPTVVKAKAVNLLMIKNLTTGTTYTFSIQATNLKGNSVTSNSLTSTPT